MDDLTDTFLLPELSSFAGEEAYSDAHPYFAASRKFRRSADILRSRDENSPGYARHVLRACDGLLRFGKNDLPPRLYIDYAHWRQGAYRLRGDSDLADFKTCANWLISIADTLGAYFPDCS